MNDVWIVEFVVHDIKFRRCGSGIATHFNPKKKKFVLLYIKSIVLFI